MSASIDERTHAEWRALPRLALPLVASTISTQNGIGVAEYRIAFETDPSQRRDGLLADDGEQLMNYRLRLLENPGPGTPRLTC